MKERVSIFSCPSFGLITVYCAALLFRSSICRSTSWTLFASNFRTLVSPGCSFKNLLWAWAACSIWSKTGFVDMMDKAGFRALAVMVPLGEGEEDLDLVLVVLVGGSLFPKYMMNFYSAGVRRMFTNTTSTINSKLVSTV